MVEPVRAPARDRNALGVLLLCGSEAVFFASLIIAYLLLSGRGGGPSARTALDAVHTGLFSLCLFASSATIYLAARALARDARGGCRGWLLATIALGAIFLVGQGREWARLLGQGITPGLNLFGSTFFTLTGFHGLHVLVGLVALLVLLGLAFTGDVTARRRSGLEAVSIYWHFVDAVWLVVFSVVYLGALV